MSLPLTELIKLGTEQLRVSGISDYERDAKELFYFFDNTDAVGLMMRWTDIMQDRQIEAYLDLVARRASGEPLQYITGKTEYIKTKTIAQWKKDKLPDLGKIPAIFLIGR